MGRKVRKKRTAAPRRRMKSGKVHLLGIKILSFLLLFGLLVFSMGAAGYVIFFRTAIANSATLDISEVNIVFEEPSATGSDLPSDITPAADSCLPMVAIIIDDMGYHEKIGRGLLALPMDITFSFLPAAPHASELEEKAFQSGRVVLLHQPMQPQSKKYDPGPGALLIGQSKDEQRRRFIANVRAVPHAVGVNNHMGSLYTEDRESMDSFMQLVKEQGLFFVDSFTSAGSQAMAAANAVGVPAVKRHIFLDNVRTQDKVCRQLDKLVQSAEENGWAVGIGHPTAATLAGLRNCREKLLKRVHVVNVQELMIKLHRL